MYYLILIIVTVIFIIVSEKSNMLRNELINSNVEEFQKLGIEKGIKNPKVSFSLGRTQLAFWTVIIVSSFIFLYIQPNDITVGFCGFVVPELNSVALALLGISAGTTLVSKTIDNDQKENKGTGIPQQDIPSKGFLTDIISDEKGVSIHRLQNVVWTLVVGFIYISYVACKCVLPDENIITLELLGLMGVSTGAYLGLKLNENKDNNPTNGNLGDNLNGSNSVPPAPPVPGAIPPVQIDDNVLPTAP
jgi:hypothetical protein